MQLFWLLPSLGFGLILGFATGQWMMAGFTLLTVFSMAIGMLIRQNQQPISDSETIHWGIGRVAVGNRKMARQSWLWKPEVRKRLTAEVLSENRLRLAQLAARNRTWGNLAVTAHRGALSYFSGFCDANEYLVDLVSAGPHAFICGPTGSGKSQYLKLMLQSLAESYSQSELLLVTIDFKGGATLSSFEGRAWLSATDLDADLSDLLAKLTSLLADREYQFSERKISRIEDAAGMPRVVVAVDELTYFLQRRGALEVLENIAARGRSLGVHLVATAQSTTGISRSLLVNLSLRIATGKLDPLELAQLGLRSASSTFKPLEGMLTANLTGNAISADICFPVISQVASEGGLKQPIRLVS